MLRTTTIKSWITILMVVVLVASVIVWYVTWPRLPRDLVLLTGDPGGEYYKLGQAIEAPTQRRIGRRVRLRVEATAGSKDNFDRLIAAEEAGNSRLAYLAIMQGGSVPIEQLATVAPLYPEYVHVIVRVDSDINRISDLAGRRIGLGQAGSGERRTAQKLLNYYGIPSDELQLNQYSFKDLLAEDSPLEGAIATTGIQHPNLIAVLRQRKYRLLSLEIAPAIEMADPFLRVVEIPKGLYAQNPPIPRDRVTTLATTAYLVTSENTNASLIDAALASIYEDSLPIEFPDLIARGEAAAWVSTRLHPVAHTYFHPADQLGTLATVLESLAAGKELLLALAALVYLCWQRWRKAIRREQAQRFTKQKDHLDFLLQKTLEIELALAKSVDPNKLQEFLNDVTAIKVKALRDFTHEELRGDTTFSIFQEQCDSLINRIQLRMIKS